MLFRSKNKGTIIERDVEGVKLNCRGVIDARLYCGDSWIGVNVRVRIRTAKNFYGNYNQRFDFQGGKEENK